MSKRAIWVEDSQRREKPTASVRLVCYILLCIISCMTRCNRPLCLASCEILCAARWAALLHRRPRLGLSIGIDSLLFFFAASLHSVGCDASRAPCIQLFRRRQVACAASWAVRCAARCVGSCAARQTVRINRETLVKFS